MSVHTHRQFLQSYMRESRLHHLSSWKAEFQVQCWLCDTSHFLSFLHSLFSHVAQPQEQLCDELMHDGAPQHRATFGHPERIIFHVDMDCFFASVVIRDNPHLRGKPLAITHSDEKGEISACSYEAKARERVWLCRMLFCVVCCFVLRHIVVCSLHH